MTAPDPIDARLARLGDDLHAATAADLAAHGAPAASRAPADLASATSDAGRPARRSPARRRAVIASVLAGAIAIPGVALAANALFSSGEAARSLPQGTLALAGTDPTCTVVREGVEFDCTLARAPQGELAPGAWKGTVEPAVGDDRTVVGGCRSQNANGTRWTCWIGREAVRNRTISDEFLGTEVAGPGAG
ncbi:hypothetical protein Q5424_22680 [Conexibacter sp. JD483]|uniref:hypothetical protein n=1 Tax=unclassified Conexibacter TaxID=2627773 RepID=UPI002720429E|nr:MULTISPECIES: hypothetical protein [unclassified Conexibacter]MDO8188451.1 hypothetical protein [Conexibacter sp. CPCC 205706]MDO8199188.1 hypothetical protein [Conexibacter sp. CPCC 205762]MDR9371921.1 hypothetical protein [Conexibacter sp. JD483]